MTDLSALARVTQLQQDRDLAALARHRATIREVEAEAERLDAALAAAEAAATDIAGRRFNERFAAWHREKRIVLMERRAALAAEEEPLLAAATRAVARREVVARIGAREAGERRRLRDRA